MKKVTSEMLICHVCVGTGIIENSELEDHHRGEYRYWDTVCTMCKGNGRLLKTVTTITTTEPYDNSKVSLLLLKETD